MGKKWARFIIWFFVIVIALVVVCSFSTSFIVKTTMGEFEGDCKTYSKSIYNIVYFLEKEESVDDEMLTEICHQILRSDCKAYLVDENGKVLATTQEDRQFNPKTIEQQWIYDVDEMINPNFDDTLAIPAMEQEESHIQDGVMVKFFAQGGVKQRLNDFFDSAERFYEIFLKDGVLLFRKSFNTNACLYVEMPAAFSENSIRRVAEAGLTFAIIIGVFLLLMIIYCISQVITRSKLYKLAFIDSVTGGINWERFKQLAEKKIHKKKSRYALVMLESDSYTVMKEMLGHNESEETLKRIYQTLSAKCSRKELVTRTQESQFVVLLSYDFDGALVKRLQEFEKEIQEILPIHFMQFHFGIVVLEDRKLSLERQLNYAYLAKNKATMAKEANTQFFRDELRSNLIKEKSLEEHMAEALENKEFKMYLQPKYSTDGKEVCGAEALVRWVSPSMGFISPGEFIPLFEKNQFIRKLDEYMLRRVCEFQRKRLDSGSRMITISVNVSRVNLSEPRLVELICDIVDEYQVPHEYIELELTESTFFDDKETLIQTTCKLREKGFSVSMDDFGSGYSSLNSLKDLQLDVVKLDAEFFRGGEEDKDRSGVIIKDTVAMAKHLDMKIVAEGIETKEQVDFLNGIGCDLIQGFYFARPMEEEKFSDLMSHQNDEKPGENSEENNLLQS